MKWENDIKDTRVAYERLCLLEEEKKKVIRDLNSNFDQCVAQYQVVGTLNGINQQAVRTRADELKQTVSNVIPNTGRLTNLR